MTPKKSIKKESKSSFDIQKLMQNSDSYKSLIYGIVTVVVLFIVIALGVRTLQQNKASIDEEALSTQKEEQNKADQYTVVEGDTLWSIAEKTYNDGFRWEEIAKANNLDDASTLEKGTKLNIPKNTTANSMDSAKPTLSPAAELTQSYAISPTLIPQKVATEKAPTAMESTGQKIAGTDYKIVEGDTLWDIAVRAYGDGYRWSEIATANSIPNPNLIYTGNSLKLPRP